MKKNRLSFFIKCFLLSSPFLTLLVFYVVKDPFKVIRTYHDYDHSEVCLCEGSVGWWKYKMYRNKEHYDSFIMGTSCTKAFNTQEWNRYIHGHPFRFFGNGECVGDVLLKLQALDKQPNQPIKNLLIVGENEFFSNTEPQKTSRNIMPPDVNGGNEMSYQMAFVQSFMYPDFLFKYMKYQYTHQFDKNMSGVINSSERQHTTYANDATMPNEDKIKHLGEKFWDQDGLNKKKYGPLHEVPRTIFAQQKECLLKIKAICDKKGTDVKIIIGPDLKKVAINSADVRVLKEIFGENNVYDYTKDQSCYNYHNFYDTGHYRVTLGDRMMKQIYEMNGEKQLAQIPNPNKRWKP
jgi:hypothetical protein